MVAIDGGVLAVENVLDLAKRAGRGLPDPPDVQGNEKQVVGIDVAGVDKPLRLLGAAARVVRVHQAALVVHELVKVTTGAR